MVAAESAFGDSNAVLMERLNSSTYDSDSGSFDEDDMYVGTVSCFVHACKYFYTIH